jgi:hypothetical protein
MPLAGLLSGKDQATNLVDLGTEISEFGSCPDRHCLE